MKRILVSGASGIVGYGILRSLAQVEESCFLVGTSIYDDSVAPAFCDHFELAPPTQDPKYLEWLLSTIRRNRIDMLIPGIDVDMHFWLNHISEIEATGALPLLNTPNLIMLCADKWEFYQRIRQEEIRCLIESSLKKDFNALSERFDLPFLLKPRRGFGSKGIVRVASKEEFDDHKSRVGEFLMAQPIVGGDDEEYTTSAFCDGEGGYFACMTMRRKLSTEGYTEKAEVSSNEQFLPAIKKLCQILNPLGPTNFQFRLCDDGPKLLEINPRISSSTSIRTAFGYNESEMALNFFLHRKTPVQPDIRQGRAVRFNDDKIFYENGPHL